ncbi:MAG: hypothetical protein H6742_00230 [Alphaproteobacteria bacterium]|nr:hypothetical protein [Alphaproteobacteria bacterium]
MSRFPVAPRRGGLPARPRVQGTDRDDYRYVEEVVRVGFPVRDARTYLARQMGNRVIYKLVEARRGEPPGHVREAEIHSASGGPTIRVRAVRTLPDGTPASYFAPDDLVQMRTELRVDGGQALPPLQPQDRILLHVPVRSYLRFLPGIYRGGVPTQRRDVVRADERAMRQYGASDRVTTTAVQEQDADQFRRFLFIFQHLMTTVTERIDGIVSLIDPTLADPRFLPWIASWVNFELDEGLPLHQQRELVRRSIRLHRTRGTSAGIEEMIAVLVGTKARVVERNKPQSCVLGAMTLAGGRTPVDRFLGGEPPAHYMVRPDRASTTFFVLMLADRETFGKEFGERASTNLRRISQIVSNEMPGHVTFTIQFDERV